MFLAHYVTIPQHQGTFGSLPGDVWIWQHKRSQLLAEVRHRKILVSGLLKRPSRKKSDNIKRENKRITRTYSASIAQIVLQLFVTSGSLNPVADSVKTPSLCAK